MNSNQSISRLHYSLSKGFLMSDTTHKPLSKEGLLHTAEILHLRGEPVPTDILARLLEVGVDVSKYS